VKRLIIVGAGGFGREVLQWAIDAGYDCGEWRIRGFLDDDPRALAAFPQVQLPIISGIAACAPRPDDFYACGLGLPALKRTCISRVLANGGRFITIVHPTAQLGANARIGCGCVICPGAVLTCDVRLGDFVTVNCQATVGHDARIGTWSTLNGHCDVTGRVHLGEGVLMGSHASVIPGVCVGDWAVIGAGSVAMFQVRPHTTVIGVPARRFAFAQEASPSPPPEARAGAKK